MATNRLPVGTEVWVIYNSGRAWYPAGPFRVTEIHEDGERVKISESDACWYRGEHVYTTREEASVAARAINSTK